MEAYAQLARCSSQSAIGVLRCVIERLRFKKFCKPPTPGCSPNALCSLSHPLCHCVKLRAVDCGHVYNNRKEKREEAQEVS
jgi:hypothetical protein